MVRTVLLILVVALAVDNQKLKVKEKESKQEYETLDEAYQWKTQRLRLYTHLLFTKLTRENQK